MTFFCDSCKYIEEFKPRKNNPQAIGCCDFGLFDDDGLIEKEVITNEQRFNQP